MTPAISRLGPMLPVVTAAALFLTLVSGRETADLILLNATVYTANDRAPRAEAVAARDGRILAVGAGEELRRLADARTRVINLRGATVLPGLTDSHYHLAGVGEREMTLNLEGVSGLEELLSRLKERVAQAKPGEWITGRGWIETHWKPPAFPTRRDLDRVSPPNPVYLTRADGHGGVANSAALRIAGITRDTASPFGGEIMKDAAGEPAGMLLDRAQALVTRHIPPPGPGHLREALLLGAERSVRLGWTQVQIAGSSRQEADLLKELCGSGRMKLRIYDAIRGPGPDADRLAQEGPEIGLFGHRFTCRAIKISFDGALGSRGAALLEPYQDHDGAGFLTQKDEELLPLFERALRAGIQVETHAIGDRANRRILDLYEKAMTAVPSAERRIRDPRWRIEHAQIVHPDDIPRFARMGIIPSMQASHAIGDLHFAPGRLGLERLSRAYAWRSFREAGCIIAGGSDAPVERGEPMIEFYAAVSRKDLKGYSGPGWHPEQRLTREEALKTLTLWPAFAAFEERIRGSIEPGKLADFTVLSADVMQIPEPGIPRTRCLMTIIGGQVVYDGRGPAAGGRKDIP